MDIGVGTETERHLTTVQNISGRDFKQAYGKPFNTNGREYRLEYNRYLRS